MFELKRSQVMGISAALLVSALALQQQAHASAISAPSPSHPSANGGQLAKVRAIRDGVSIAPPKRHYAKGKLKQGLSSQYAVRTLHGQLTSLAFNDGTILQVDELTSLVLRSSSTTALKQGEVDQVVQPGSDHAIATPFATASAIGTEWDTLCRKAACFFTAVEGVVRVTAQNGQGVLVKAGQQTIVRKGQSPTQPSEIDAGAVTAWVRALPAAPISLGKNLALDSNGGQVVASSNRASEPNSWDAAHLHDGDPSTGWQTATGKASAESVTFSFNAGNIYRLTGIVIDPAATGGQDPSNDLKSFQVRASRDGGSPVQVLSGQTVQQDSLQTFRFDAPVDADHVQLVLLDNFGGAEGIAVSEVEIVGRRVAVATPLPTSTPEPTATNTSTPTPVATATSPASHLFKIDLTTPAQAYPADATSPPESETVEAVAQTCGPTPWANPWSGTQIDHVVATQDGSSRDFSYTLAFTLVSTSSPTIIFGSPSGAYVDLLVSGSTARLRWFGDVAFGPNPPETEVSGAVVDGGPC